MTLNPTTARATGSAPSPTSAEPDGLLTRTVGATGGDGVELRQRLRRADRLVATIGSEPLAGLVDVERQKLDLSEAAPRTMDRGVQAAVYGLQ